VLTNSAFFSSCFFESDSNERLLPVEVAASFQGHKGRSSFLDQHREVFSWFFPSNWFSRIFFFFPPSRTGCLSPFSLVISFWARTSFSFFLFFLSRSCSCHFFCGPNPRFFFGGPATRIFFIRCRGTLFSFVNLLPFFLRQRVRFFFLFCTAAAHDILCYSFSVSRSVPFPEKPFFIAPWLRTFFFFCAGQVLPPLRIVSPALFAPGAPFFFFFVHTFSFPGRLIGFFFLPFFFVPFQMTSFFSQQMPFFLSSAATLFPFSFTFLPLSPFWQSQASPDLGSGFFFSGLRRLRTVPFFPFCSP